MTTVNIAHGLTATRNADGSFRIDCADAIAFNLLASTMSVAHSDKAARILRNTRDDDAADAMSSVRFHQDKSNRWMEARRLSLL